MIGKMFPKFDLKNRLFPRRQTNKKIKKLITSTEIIKLGLLRDF